MKIRLDKITHSVRASQAVLQYGVGAMVDFPDQTLMTAAPEYWENSVVKIHDERFEKALNVDYFGMPGGQDFSEGISYARFPEWYFCPKCRRFQPLKAWKEEFLRKAPQRIKEYDSEMVKNMKCPSCWQDLVVARIITVCSNGHIDDFPWVKWVHCQNGGGKARKKICAHPVLKFKSATSSSEGLENLSVTCETCGAKATLKGAFDNDIFERLDRATNGEYGFTCTGRHPWKNSKEACVCYPKTIQRGSSSVYFPVTASSLVIPPFSSQITVKIEKSKAFHECEIILGEMMDMDLPFAQLQTIIENKLQKYSEKISFEIGIPKDYIEAILKRKFIKEDNSDVYTVGTQSIKYRSEEYEALTGEVSFKVDLHDDFIREAMNIEDYKLPFIKSVSLIHKMREVQALLGFSRLNPSEASDFTNPQSNIVSVKESKTNWYPACEVRGEGIFIEFNSDDIKKWCADNDEIQQRVSILNDNYKNSFMGRDKDRTITSKFVLLHTISHLLIKQLSFECGYSISSLKERIYCSELSDGKEMSGILIYTASGDSEGTMGGLVRQGKPDIFPSVFKKAIQSAIICSNDPVCSLSHGQGRESLNLSACYSCCLIPETSCEEYNAFLDRGLVVGTLKNKNIGLFYEQLFGNQKWD